MTQILNDEFFDNLIKEDPKNIVYIFNHKQLERIIGEHPKYIIYLDKRKSYCYYHIALKSNGMIIEYLDENVLTVNHWIVAIDNNPDAFKFLKYKHLNQDVCKYTISYCGSMIQYLFDETSEFTDDEIRYYLELAIRSDPKSIYYMEKRKELCELAYSLDKSSVLYMLNKVKSPYTTFTDRGINYCKLKGCGHVFRQEIIEENIINQQYYCNNCSELFLVEFMDDD